MRRVDARESETVAPTPRPASPFLRRSRFLVDISIGAAVFLVAPALALRAYLKPTDPLAQVGVIYGPWVSGADAAARATSAGASFVRFGARDFIVVVQPARSDYAERALARGALLALDPKSSALCEPPPPAKI